MTTTPAPPSAIGPYRVLRPIARGGMAEVYEVEARGSGVDVVIRRENPMKGVSGVLTLTAVLSSVIRARGTAPGLTIC